MGKALCKGKIVKYLTLIISLLLSTNTIANDGNAMGVALTNIASLSVVISVLLSAYLTYIVLKPSDPSIQKPNLFFYIVSYIFLFAIIFCSIGIILFMSMSVMVVK